MKGEPAMTLILSIIVVWSIGSFVSTLALAVAAKES